MQKSLAKVLFLFIFTLFFQNNRDANKSKRERKASKDKRGAKKNSKKKKKSFTPLSNFLHTQNNDEKGRERERERSFQLISARSYWKSQKLKQIKRAVV